MSDPTNLDAMSPEEFAAFLAGQRAAAQGQSAQPAADSGYGQGIRPPDASSGRGIDVWVGDDRAQPPPPPAQPPEAAAIPTPAPPQQAPPVAPGPDPQFPVLRGLNDRVKAVARGVPVLGAGADEANAAILAGIAPYAEPVARRMPHLVQALMGYDPSAEIGDLPTYRQRYEAAKNFQTLSDRRFDQAHPKESLALQVGGGVAGTLAMLPFLGAATSAAGPEAGLLLRSGAGAVEGAGAGAAHGYLAGEGGFTDPNRLKGAEMGGLIGAGAGAALPIAAHVAGQAWRATGGRLVDAIRGERTVQGPAAGEAAKLAETLRGGEHAPMPASMPGEAAVPAPTAGPRDNVEAALVSARREPVKARASEVDDAYVRIARAIDRGLMTPEEAAQRARDLGPFGVLADASPASQDLLRAAINRPGKGGTIARDNLTPRQQGVFNKETGEYDIRPSSLRITDKAAEGLGVADKQFHQEIDDLLAKRKADADPLYTQMRSHPPVAVSEMQEFAASPEFAKAYQGAREISQKEFVRVPGVEGEAIMPLPKEMPTHLDWRTLDLMKQAMGDTISTAPQQGIGASSRGASKGYLQRFVDRLDELNPDYKAARDAFAGPSAMKDALEEGRKLLREDHYLIGKRLGEMSESERQMTRLGALQELKTKLGNANVTFDAANQAGLLKPNQLARFKELFPDRKAFGDFITTLENEKAMFGTSQAAFGNSTTAKQILNVMEPSDPQLEGATQAITSAGTGNLAGIIHAIRRMGMESPMREGVAETIASVLTNHDHAGLPDAVAKMNAARRAAYVSDAVRNSMGTGAGQAAGRAAQPAQ